MMRCSDLYLLPQESSRDDSFFHTLGRTTSGRSLAEFVELSAGRSIARRLLLLPSRGERREAVCPNMGLYEFEALFFLPQKSSAKTHQARGLEK